jgi:hypothetical protein
LVGLAFLWLERSLWHGFNMPQAAEVTVRREKALDFGGGQNGKSSVGSSFQPDYKSSPQAAAAGDSIPRQSASDERSDEDCIGRGRNVGQ